jgi:hypothetical protein
MKPSQFFEGRLDEGRLADAIWEAAPQYPLDGNPLQSVTKLPWASQRVIRAGLLAVEMRHAPELAKKRIGHALDKCNPHQRADVEHFWCGAFLGTVMGPGVMGAIGSAVISFAWDGVISPLDKIMNQGYRGTRMLEALKYDMKQFTGPDANGIKFALLNYGPVRHDATETNMRRILLKK